MKQFYSASMALRGKICVVIERRIVPQKSNSMGSVEFVPLECDSHNFLFNREVHLV